MTSLAPALRVHVERYAESHRHPVNRALHAVGIPLLAVASLGLLSRVRPFASAGPDAGRLALAAAGVWYLGRDPAAGGAALAALAAGYAVGRRLPPRHLATMLAAGAAIHAVGHYRFEGKPPAVFTRPVAVLEAPVWLLTTGARSACDGRRAMRA
jgi:uncharacterized membrane protein YGL010W